MRATCFYLHWWLSWSQTAAPIKSNLISYMRRIDLYSGAGSMCRWRVCHGLGRCVTASSCWLSLQAISMLCITGKTSSSLMWYPSCRLILTWQCSHTARSMRDFLQDMNVSILPWPAKSPDLNLIEHTWDLLDRRVRARAIPPPEMSGNLPVPWWKSGVTSHCKNCQIWCSPWGGDAPQYLMQLVATPETDCYFWFWPPSFFFSGTHYSIYVSHMSVELVQFVLVVESYVHTNIYKYYICWK